MNQKQPSSGNRMKPRTLLKFVIPTAGLILAFGSMLSLTTCSIRHPPGFRARPSLSELDKLAQPHFDQAKQSIPAIAENRGDYLLLRLFLCLKEQDIIGILIPADSQF